MLAVNSSFVSKTQFSISILFLLLLQSCNPLKESPRLSFCQQSVLVVEKSWPTTHRSREEETEEIANQNKTSIMQLPGCGPAGSVFSFVLVPWCHESGKGTRRIIQTPSLETTGYGNHFLFMQMEIFNWHWNVSPALGMYELAQAGGDVLSCLIWVFKIPIWKVWMAAVGRVVTGPWRWGMIPRLRFHLVYNSWHNVHRFPEFIFRPSVPDPVSSWSSKSCLKPRQSAHHSEEDNKIKIKYILPASNFNLHMHGGDDSNPWRCCGRCCCPGLIAWPLILAWQPLWAVSASLKLFSKLLYWCEEEEEQSQVQTLNDRVALFGHIATLLLWTVVLMLKIKS